MKNALKLLRWQIIYIMMWFIHHCQTGYKTLGWKPTIKYEYTGKRVFICWTGLLDPESRNTNTLISFKLSGCPQLMLSLFISHPFLLQVNTCRPQTTKKRWNQDFKGKEFGHQICLSIAPGKQAKRSPFSKRCFVILAPGKGKWKQVAEKEQSQGLSAQSANPNKSWERFISKTSFGGKWWGKHWNGDGKDRWVYIQPRVFPNPFNTSGCSK